MSESSECYGMRPNAPVELRRFRLFENNIFVPVDPSAPLHLPFDSAFSEDPAKSSEDRDAADALQQPELPPSEEDMARAEIARLREEAERIRLEALQEAEMIRTEAHRRTEEVRLTGEKLIEEARKQAEEIEARAYQAGFEQGEEAGRKLGEQKADLVIKSLRSIIEAAVAQRDALLKASEQDLVKTAFLIALRLMHREIRQDPAVVLDMVRATLEKIRKSSRVIVQVAPPDFKFLEEHIEEIRSLEGGEMKIQLEPNEEVGRGGCRILSDVGEVDARIETMLDAFRKQIWEEI